MPYFRLSMMNFTSELPEKMKNLRNSQPKSVDRDNKLQGSNDIF